MIYCEQISHHPPISSFLIEGGSSCPFKMHGYIEYKVQVQGAFSSVHISMPGKINLELTDGTVYDMEYPQMEVEGLLSDVKVLNPIGAITVKDNTNNLKVIVKFDA